MNSEKEKRNKKTATTCSNSNFKDITGNKYQMLTVLGLSEYQKKGNKYWDCLCDCGQKTVLPTCEIKRSLSCGCKMKTAQINISGRRYDMLTVIEFSHTTSTAIRMWKCVCDCGTEVITSYCKLNTSRKRNCGCVALQNLKDRRLEEGQASFNVLYGNYRRSAEKKSQEFSLTKHIFAKTINYNCYYCNEPPSNLYKNKSGTGDYRYNGIDRIDNSIGYVENNIVPCCTMCNFAKNKNTIVEFMDWIERLKNREKLFMSGEICSAEDIAYIYQYSHNIKRVTEKLKEEKAGEKEDLF